MDDIHVAKLQAYVLIDWLMIEREIKESKNSKFVFILRRSKYSTWLTFNPLKTTENLKKIYRLHSYLAVNTLCLIYKNQ
jgi:hypothetical protein